MQHLAKTNVSSFVTDPAMTNPEASRKASRIFVGNNSTACGVTTDLRMQFLFEDRFL
jgi:hypothetical protein